MSLNLLKNPCKPVIAGLCLLASAAIAMAQTPLELAGSTPLQTYDKGWHDFDTAELGKADYVAIYHSAQWCPPCRGFTPDLVKFYNRAKKEHPGKFELVFLSHDRSAEAHEQYMKQYKMEWPTIKFGAHTKLGKFREKSGIPFLVVLDAKGDVVAMNRENGQFTDPREVLKKVGKLLKEDKTTGGDSWPFSKAVGQQ